MSGQTTKKSCRTTFVIALLPLSVLISIREQPALTIAHELTLTSAILGEDRPILVHLPASYETDTAHYPVLYLLDGRQNMMHVAGSVEVLSRTGQIPPLIVAGIPAIDRERDFTPGRVQGFRESGGGPRFLDFIARELVPYIDRTYRTHPFRVLEGHSLGGTLTAYALLNRPELFDAYILMSPALWWNDEELTARAETALDDPGVEHTSIFFGIGAEDGLGMRQELRRFVGVFERKPRTGTRWRHQEFEGEGHMSAPLLANYYGLKMVFADLQLPVGIRQAFTSRAFLDHEARITARYGDAAAQSGESYVTLGLTLMKEERYADAVTVLTRNAEVYDTYPPSFRWLAAAHEQNGNLRAALENYEIALELSKTVKVGGIEENRAHVERLKALLKEP